MAEAHTYTRGSLDVAGLLNAANAWIGSQMADAPDEGGGLGAFLVDAAGEYAWEEHSEAEALDALSQGVGLFIPFAMGNFGDAIACLDGQTHVIEYPEDDDELDDFDPQWGEFDAWGYLIRGDGDALRVTLAMASDDPARPNSGSIHQDVACPFPARMNEYLGDFVG